MTLEEEAIALLLRSIALAVDARFDQTPGRGAGRPL